MIGLRECKKDLLFSDLIKIRRRVHRINHVIEKDHRTQNFVSSWLSGSRHAKPLEKLTVHKSKSALAF
jgi:hypothetical protein